MRDEITEEVEPMVVSEAETSRIETEDDVIVTICEACRTAACWWGIFMCYDSASANVTKVLRRDLVKERRESPDYFSDATIRKHTSADPERGVCPVLH